MPTLVGMNNHRHSGVSHLNRRIRLSKREIAIAVVLTVAALTGIVFFSFGESKDETAMSQPTAEIILRPE